MNWVRGKTGFGLLAVTDDWRTRRFKFGNGILNRRIQDAVQFRLLNVSRFKCMNRFNHVFGARDAANGFGLYHDFFLSV